MTEEPHLTSGRRARACEVECEALSGFRHSLINRDVVPS